MTTNQPADIATLREALHCLGECTGDLGFYRYPDYLMVSAALDELAAARERIAKMGELLWSIQQGLFTTSLYQQCPICKGKAHWVQDGQEMSQKFSHTLECPFKQSNILLTEKVAECGGESGGSEETK